jgi:hypothetical membrane protein
MVVFMHMQPFKNIKTFKDRYPLVGPTIWIVSIHYFIIQIIVARAWEIPFSMRNNPISDLGNTACGIYNTRFVCSPKNALMNASFVTLGVIMIAGSLLIYQEFKKTAASRIGFSFMGIAGFGTILVGVFPENTIGFLHLLGAGLPFLIGNIGITILGLRLDLPKSLRVYTLVTGIITLTALLLLLTGMTLGIGFGGIERVTAYPQTLWLIFFGIYISSNHMRQGRRVST